MLRLVVAASLLVVVAGCTDPEPKPKEPKPSASATPTITAPTIPAQARENSPEGAAAFVNYYIDVFNYAAATGDVTELSRLSSPSCEGCKAYIKLYRDTYEAGGYFRGGEWTLGELQLELGGVETYATTNATTAATKYRENADISEQSGPAESNKITFAVIGSATDRRISQLALGDAG